jgi:hypothetical protein
MNRKSTSNNRVKFVCYPMVGGVEQQAFNLLHTLKWIHNSRPSQRSEVWKWLQIAFRSRKPLVDKYAQNIYSVLLSGPGLVEVENGKCRLTRDGYIVLHSSSYDRLLEAFAKNFVGLIEIMEILQNRDELPTEVLLLEWFATTSSRFHRMRCWGERHISNQFRIRVDWLRASGVIEVENGKFRLTTEGQQFMAEHPPESLLLSSDEIQAEEKIIRAQIDAPFTTFDKTVARIKSSRQAYVRSRVFRNIVVKQYNYAVVKQYNYACAVCNFRLSTPDNVYEIQAAHIIPRSKRGTDDPRNGIGLCGIHHWAFDKGVISVLSSDLTIRVAAYIKAHSADPSGAQIVQYAEQPIRSTVNPEYAPATPVLEWHNENVFID